MFANNNYGFAVSLATFGTVKTAVACTSCHDQHSQNIYAGKMGGVQGYYKTMFFLRGYYNPATGGNNTAQFCRQCHGGEANEMQGSVRRPDHLVCLSFNPGEGIPSPIFSERDHEVQVFRED